MRSSNLGGNAASRGARPARSTARAAVIALGAAVLFGGWAAWANSGSGPSGALKSAAVQAALSGASTFCLTLLLEWFFRWTTARWGRLALGMALGPATVALVMSSVHWGAGTHHVLRTVFPSVVSGTIFCAVYTLGIGLGATKRQ